jgi:hypothetical protein
MRVEERTTISALLGVLAAASFLVACSSGSGPSNGQAGGGAGQTATDNGAGTGDGGTTGAASKPLLCAPLPAQTTACSGLSAGAACTLTRSFGDGDGDADDDGGVKSIAGTCRSTFDGTGVACVPNPPAPPAALTRPCSGMVAGATCEVQGRFGGFQGTCFDARGSGTLICGRVRTPPQPLIDACSGKAAGDGCALGERRDGGTFPGVCGNGPTGLGPLACEPSRDPMARLAEACSGLDAGTVCLLGKEQWGVEGTCTAPAGGGTALCIPPCPGPHRGFPHPPPHWWPPEPRIPLAGGPDAGP